MEPVFRSTDEGNAFKTCLRIEILLDWRNGFEKYVQHGAFAGGNIIQPNTVGGGFNKAGSFEGRGAIEVLRLGHVLDNDPFLCWVANAKDVVVNGELVDGSEGEIGNGNATKRESFARHSTVGKTALSVALGIGDGARHVR